jgi:hypothetical protein
MNREALLQALTERALAGDIEAAKLVLAEPRRITMRIDDECSARGAYKGLWESLANGQITVNEAKDLLDILGRVERYL